MELNIGLNKFVMCSGWVQRISEPKRVNGYRKISFIKFQMGLHKNLTSFKFRAFFRTHLHMNLQDTDANLSQYDFGVLK